MPENKTAGQTDIKSFQNPQGYWEYAGPFIVELVPHTDTSIVPASAEIRGDTVHVSRGRVEQEMGGIQLYSYESPFYFGYRYIKAIRGGSGTLLWVNYNHR